MYDREGGANENKMVLACKKNGRMKLLRRLKGRMVEVMRSIQRTTRWKVEVKRSIESKGYNYNK